jgi:hypothetical protein
MMILAMLHPAAPHHYVAPPVAHHQATLTTQAKGLYDSAQPSAIPHGVSQALYADGGYAAPASDERGHKRTLWIDVTGYDYSADVLDVEKYDATPQQAGPWAEAAYKNHGKTRPVIIYTAVSTWHLAEISVAQYAPHVPVKYWVASPSYAYPHMAPGACATQWDWTPGYNASETLPCFWTP